LSSYINVEKIAQNRTAFLISFYVIVKICPTNAGFNVVIMKVTKRASDLLAL